MLIPLADLQPGMAVAHDVRSRQGQLLVAAGSVLTPRHLTTLRTWGIPGIHIADPEAAERAARAVTREEVIAAERHERPRFARCNLEHPLVKALWVLALRRRIHAQRRP